MFGGPSLSAPMKPGGRAEQADAEEGQRRRLRNRYEIVARRRLSHCAGGRRLDPCAVEEEVVVGIGEIEPDAIVLSEDEGAEPMRPMMLPILSKRTSSKPSLFISAAIRSPTSFNCESIEGIAQMSRMN